MTDINMSEIRLVQVVIGGESHTIQINNAKPVTIELTAGGTNITSVYVQAMNAANAPGGDNPFATITDVSGKEDAGIAQSIIDVHELIHPIPTNRDIRNQIVGSYAPALGLNDNYVTDAEKIVLSNTSNVNTGDQDLSVKENTGVAAGLLNTHESTHPIPTIRDSRNEIANVNIQAHVLSAHAPADAQKNADITKAEIEAKLTGVLSSHTHVVGSTFQNKLDGIIPPTVADDAGIGYSVGSFWIDSVGHESYRCLDATLGAAIWVNTTLGTDDLATVAVTGSVDDLIDGTTNKVFLATERTAILANTAKVTNAAHTGEVTGADALILQNIAITNKTLVTAVGTDHVLIADASDAGNLKKALISDFASAGGDMATATYDPRIIGSDAFAMDNMTEGTTNKILTAGERAIIAATSGSNTGDQDLTSIQAHVAAVTGNPHSVTKTDLGLANVPNIDCTNAGNITTGVLPTSVLPALSFTTVTVVISEIAQLALTAQEGDVAVRTDENKTYMHNGGVLGTMADWTLLNTPTDAVTSVNGQTGVVSLSAANVGADPADTASGLMSSHNSAHPAPTNRDVRNEPANANIQAHISSIANPHTVTKAQVGLGSVDNTADSAKPVSTAQQTALDGKAAAVHDHASITGTAAIADALNTANTYNVAILTVTPNISGVSTGLTVTNGDLTAFRTGGTQGILYLSNDGTKYLYNDGTKYILNAQGLDVGGAITATNFSGSSSGTNTGDAHTVASHTDTTATGAQLNTLVGGGETTLHSHATSGSSLYFEKSYFGGL